MPVPLLEAHIAWLPRLQAEEAIAMAAAVAAGSGRLSDEGRAAWASLTRPAHEAVRPAPRPAREPGRREVPVARLRAMGSAVVIVPAKAKG